MAEYGRYAIRQIQVPPGEITSGVTAGATTAPWYANGLTNSAFTLVAVLNSGAGNLTVQYQDSPDLVNWTDWAVFATLSATGADLQVANRTQNSRTRLRYVITGTANYTFSVYEAGYAA